MKTKDLISMCLSLTITFTMLPALFSNDVSAAVDEAAYWDSFSCDCHYDNVPEDIKPLYDIIDEAYEKALLSSDDLTSVKIDISSLEILNETKLLTVVKWFGILVRNDNPQYFFVTNDVYCSKYYTKSGKTYLGEIDVGIYPDFKKGKDRTKAKNEIKNVVDSYVSGIPSGSRPEEAEKYIHDKMCANIVYGSYVTGKGTKMDQNIYSAIKNKTVCNGYAILFEAIMNNYGIECTMERSQDHAWNAINLYGNWYNVDVTHDDRDDLGGIWYGYYNCRYNLQEDGTPYKPLEFYEIFDPEMKYEGMADGFYTPRYFNKNGNEYFVVNDSTDYGERKALLLNSCSSSYDSTVRYLGKNYTVITNEYSVISSNPTPYSNDKEDFSDFVERLYCITLGRPSDASGRQYWCDLVGSGQMTGADCARFFLTSDEIMNKLLTKEDFVRIMYYAFFDRDGRDDPDGLNFWVASINNAGFESVVEGFINSPEWVELCASYGIKSGSQYKKTSASDNAIKFATRLYTQCLGRDPEKAGLDYWSLGLTNQDLSGTQAAREFFYSDEFKNHNFSNDEYINRLYRTFMGREPDDEGKAYWLDLMSKGTTRDEVFNFFSVCDEFTQICKDYNIVR
ncbi:MAG: DUF4214 domain-containing protein [Clostridiales bacterium]|nr:DUF4214 domain-containing protein [Clostridiales bacterium]